MFPCMDERFVAVVSGAWKKPELQAGNPVVVSQISGVCCVSRPLGFLNACRGFASELHDDLAVAQQPYDQ